MRLLITGGLGFIGSNLIKYLFEKHNNIRIVNLDNLSIGSNVHNLKNEENEERYEFVKGDICDKRLVNNLIKRVDAVINVAAETHVDRSILDPSSFIKSNTEGVFILLEAIRHFDKNIKLLHVSTDEVYGDILTGSFREDDPLKPSSPYSASKGAGDLFCISYHRTYGLDTTITRCTNNFGPNQFPEKIIPKAIVKAQLGQNIPIYGKGQNVRDWLYVEDHCQALDLVLHNGKPGEIYNISSGNEYDNLSLINKIIEVMRKDKDLIEFVEDRPGHDLRYSLDSTKLRNELGWSPHHTFHDALETTIKWYLSNEWWWRPLANKNVLSSTPWK